MSADHPFGSSRAYVRRPMCKACGFEIPPPPGFAIVIIDAGDLDGIYHEACAPTEPGATWTSNDPVMQAIEEGA